MNKLKIIAFILLCNVTVNAQSAFSKLEKLDHVESIVVTKDAFRIMSTFRNNSEEGKKYEDLVKSIVSLEIYKTSDATTASIIKKSFQNHLKNNKLTELVRVNEKDSKVTIMVKESSKKEHIKELLMLVTKTGSEKGSDFDTMILSLLGDIDLNRIAEITAPYYPESKKYLKSKKK